MIQIQLQPEIEAQLAAEAQAHSLTLDHYVEMIVRARTVEQVSQRSVAEAIDHIRELRKGNKLRGLKIKNLIHEGQHNDGDVRCGRLGDAALVFRR